MSLRITQSMVSQRQLDAVQRSAQSLAEATRQATSQKRIAAPSDDPTGAARAVGLRDALSALDGHGDAVATASGWLGSAGSALQGVSDALGRARELALLGSTASTTAEGRASIAAELRSVVDTVKDLANASYDGSYVFAGTATGTRPYAAGSDAYGGSPGVVAQQVGPGTSVQTNPVDGGALFGSATGDGGVLDVLRTIAGHLDAGDTTALGGSDLRALAGATDAIGVATARVGAAQVRVDAAASRLDATRTTTTKALSGVQDADLATSLLTLTSEQTAYQAALKATATIVGTSLMDFLR